MNAKTAAALNVGATFCHVRAPSRGRPPHTEHKGHIFASSQALLKKPKQSLWGNSGVAKAMCCLSPQRQTWATHSCLAHSALFKAVPWTWRAVARAITPCREAKLPIVFPFYGTLKWAEVLGVVSVCLFGIFHQQNQGKFYQANPSAVTSFLQAFANTFIPLSNIKVIHTMN